VAGDERDFRRLVEPYGRALEVHCYRMLGSPQDAEDLAQETLLRAWRSLGRFERRASVQTWPYRIATNACPGRARAPAPPARAVRPDPDARVEPAASPAAAAERELLRRYVDAWECADVDALVPLLRADAVLRMPPGRTVHASVEIVRFLHHSCAGGVTCRIELAPTRANGRPALAMHDGDEPHGVLVLETDGRTIGALDAFIDPALVARFATSA
jgi:DNA-directed RNA polymerase specialized sigma24 family protein